MLDLDSGPPPLTLTETTNGPALWSELLAQLPGAVVAGGAVRDYFLGVEPKDIDIFLSSDKYTIPEGFEPLGDDRSSEYAALPDIAIVTRGTINGFQVDLVGMANLNAETLLDTFDFGISRSMFADGVIVDTPEAKFDRDNKVVTMILDDRTERSVKRFERFNERMGGVYDLVKYG
jgi:hypothetical protein